MTNKEIIYLGGGCFWCIESIFNQIKSYIKDGTFISKPNLEERINVVKKHLEFFQGAFLLIASFIPSQEPLQG